MPTPTYTPLATVTLGSSASSVTFSSIPATYRDLVLVLHALGSTTIEARMRFNGDTGSNYSFVGMIGDGTGATSPSTASRVNIILSSAARATVTDYLQVKASVMDYSATDKHKTVLSRSNQAAGATEAFANRWANTSAITSLEIATDTGTWAVGSTFNLFGIAS
jgi:hypothetical protein